MGFSLHFNELMTIGLILLPTGFVVFWFLVWIFQAQEIGAMAIGGIGAMICWIAGIVMILLGIGQQLH